MKNTPKPPKTADTMSGVLESQIVDIARKFSSKDYAKAFRRFEGGGQTVNIRLHNAEDVVADYFAGVSAYRNYKQQCGPVRSMRNALVHDLRLGRVEVGNGKVLIPRPSVVNQYRPWSKIAEAALSAHTLRTNFVDPKIQAGEDVFATLRVLNELYAKLLADFQSEFEASQRSKLRELFQVEYGDPAQNQHASEIGNADLGSASYPLQGKAMGAPFTPQVIAGEPDSASLQVATGAAASGTTSAAMEGNGSGQSTPLSGVAHPPRPPASG